MSKISDDVDSFDDDDLQIVDSDKTDLDENVNVILKPVITVFGVGGAGGNAINNMISANFDGAEFVVANTDAQALKYSNAQTKIQLGARCTKGLGAGSSPEVGEAAARESADLIRKCLKSSNMLFITAGMGGGTGSGASPVIAEIAKELGILTVGVVTKPFTFEGRKRAQVARTWLKKLQEKVDTLIVIPNQNLFYVANSTTSLTEAFKICDAVLYHGVRNIVDLMIMPGLINLDFADIKTIMSEMGKAMMGTGESEGEGRAIAATEAAITSPLLDHDSMIGATGVLISITGGTDMTLCEVDSAANLIREKVDPNANIIIGSTFDPGLGGKIRVSVVATGMDPIKKDADQCEKDDVFTETRNSSLQDKHVDDVTTPEFEEYFDLLKHQESKQKEYSDFVDKDFSSSDQLASDDQSRNDESEKEDSASDSKVYVKQNLSKPSTAGKKSILRVLWDSVRSTGVDDENIKDNNGKNDVKKKASINSDHIVEIRESPTFSDHN